jgi:glycerophosphoryl diester phosphodiesterase
VGRALAVTFLKILWLRSNFAYSRGATGLSLTCAFPLTGEAVVCHDAAVDGMEIEKTVSKRLTLPTLEEVLRQFADRAFLDIELKVAGLERLLLAELRGFPPQKGYVVSSFFPDVLTAIHDFDPTIPLGFLCDSRDQLRGWRETPAEWVIPQYRLANRELVELVQAAGKKAMVWTVNHASRMREFAAWDVDAIISDETELLVRTLR